MPYRCGVLGRTIRSRATETLGHGGAQVGLCFVVKSLLVPLEGCPPHSKGHA